MMASFETRLSTCRKCGLVVAWGQEEEHGGV